MKVLNFCTLIILIMDIYTESFGNEILPSRLGLEGRGCVVIPKESKLRKGILFAFRAFFHASTLVRFQVWRLLQNESSSKVMKMKLMHEYSFTSIYTGARDDYYIQDNCPLVTDNDYVGMYFDESPAAVSYMINFNVTNTIMKYQSEPYRIGTIVDFDNLEYPYIFSMLAYVDTDINKYSISNGFAKCDENFKIELSSQLVEDWYRFVVDLAKLDKTLLKSENLKVSSTKEIIAPSSIWTILSSKYFIIGILIWLIILTLIVFTIICKLSCSSVRSLSKNTEQRF
ncbi:hypothetical protein A3Q56_04056 [Intoshia linei]|uniref:Uncharacterized protein n=1 Tax=Intoshia linei TaxID=1819745 RepID=A0A177B440_9BILA|nr:hypothetical protein A3Q56_04056 [Intoshia linei]